MTETETKPVAQSCADPTHPGRPGRGVVLFGIRGQWSWEAVRRNSGSDAGRGKRALVAWSGGQFRWVGRMPDRDYK